MKIPPLVIALNVWLPLTAVAQSSGNFPSLPSKVLSTYTPTVSDTPTPEKMAAAAATFLEALDSVRRSEASLPYDSAEKALWTNVPPRGPQGGVRLGDLNADQLELACNLLATVLSAQGYFKAINIPLADDRLLRNGERRPGFGAEDYWLAIFGTPSATEPWALQFDGHHLAINLAFQGEGMSMSPTFIGTQPRGFELKGEAVEPMRGKDATALGLLRTLGESQQEAAILGKTRGNLVAGAGRDGRVPEPVGVSAGSFNEGQKAALMSVIQLYVEDLPGAFAKRRLTELEKEIPEMTFAWWGPATDGGDYSYRIQGPTLIIEYAGQDLGGDPHDHLHSIYRDPTNEYGARISE
ncbi:MAG: DUF3500 domain-containing protein [Verrucomicrobiota bacterium]